MRYESGPHISQRDIWVSKGSQVRVFEPINVVIGKFVCFVLLRSAIAP